jgi:hypothetical protein
MKRLLSLTIGLIVALWCAAIDRFYIEDFTISSGETRTISILLENEIEYTAFQSDIYLPEGLSVEMDGDYYVFELSDRKARSHILSTAVQNDGAIRLLCYSSSVSPFKGSSGALVYMNVIASNDFVGPKTILIKNTRFGTTTGQEIQFPDEICNVTSSSPSLRGDVNGDGEVNIADINAVIDMILSGRFDTKGDVNGDSEINIADINAVIDLILSN